MSLADEIKSMQQISLDDSPIDPVEEKDASDEFPTFRIDQTIPEDQVRWQLTPLYKVGAVGALLLWWIAFDAETNELIMSHGQENGVIQENRTLVHLNNSGRSLHEQALLEARQRYKLQIRNKGYRPFGEAAPILKAPSLANKLQDLKTPLSFPVAVQVKIDGIRCLVRQTDDGSLEYRSRSNREYPHLNSQFDSDLQSLLEYLPNGAQLDGELWIQGTTLIQTTTVVRNEVKLHADIGKLKYYIFDVNTADALPYEDRWMLLVNAQRRMYEDGLDPTRFVILNCIWAYSMEQIESVHDEFVAEGYEGAMIKKLYLSNPTEKGLKESIYKSGRSSNILKYKQFEDEEATIIGVTEAGGTEKGCALFIVRTNAGAELTIRPQGTFEQRREWFNHPEEVLNRPYTIRMFGLTDYGVPRIAVGVAIRDYE